MQIEEIPVWRLRKTKFLKRRHSKEQMDRCVHSIVTFGQYAPIVVSGREVICGTMVLDAFRRLKRKRIFAVQVGELSDDRKKELRYLDNRTFDMSFWKDDDLKVFLMGLSREALWDCGFSEEETEGMINGFVEDGKKAKKSIMRELNRQPDTWYCPSCGWTGTVGGK